MRLKFTKMHGLGNDFVVFDAISQKIELTLAQLRFIADRHFGIGCDQILLVESPTCDDADFRYRIFNADGSEVGQCGNGARCFARFVYEQGLTDKREIRVETASGIIVPRLETHFEVTVNMGAPRFEPTDIPFMAQQRLLTYSLTIADQLFEISAVSMGNPHAVRVVDDVDTAFLERDAPLIEHDVRFPESVNVGFMQVLNRNHIKLRVHERGSGETLACGTGACAAAVLGITRGLLDSRVSVSMRGGDLSIAWNGENTPVWMTGPATRVFDGELDL